ncbi:MAG: TVP38/TMEM64 family protein [Methylococcaceae bacterium]|jgi:uncharacterized membrane protein YdjX (TVP38/TMEM64 family)
MGEQQRKTLRAALVLAFIVGLGLFFILGGHEWLSLAYITSHRDQLSAFTDSHYFLMLLGSMLLYITSTALSLPGASALSLVMGMLFGVMVGTLATLLAATVGATLVFWSARFVFADAARSRLAAYPRATRLLEGFDGNGFRYLLFLRLMPLFPFWLVNLAPALTRMTTQTYVMATLVGIIPGCFAYVYLGHTLGDISRVDDLLSGKVLAGLALLGVLVLVPGLLKARVAGGN